MNSKQNIAIIPARGGSRRIPRKNIKEFFGIPVIAYSIETAIKSGLFYEVMVSTDNIEIADIAKQYGAKIPFLRSAKNSSDFATTNDVLYEVLEEYKKLNKMFDNLCCIYPTAPLVTPEKLIDSFNLMIKKNTNSVIPVVKYSYPIQRAFRIIEENRLEYIWPENIEKRSQDLECAYHDAGQFYWVKIKEFVSNRNIFTRNTIGYLLGEDEVQDIDEAMDWRMAELKYRLKN